MQKNDITFRSAGKNCLELSTVASETVFWCKFKVNFSENLKMN